MSGVKESAGVNALVSADNGGGKKELGMSRSQYGLTLVMTMIAGLAGGLVSTHLFTGGPVCAQQPPQQAEVVRAEKFEVIDKGGKARIVLTVKDDGSPTLGLLDQD